MRFTFSVPSPERMDLLSVPKLALLSVLSIASCLAQTHVSDRSDVIRSLQRGDNQAALSQAQQALTTHPRDCALLSLQAIAQTGLQLQDPALASFLQALTFCPTYLPALEGAAQIESVKQAPEAIPLLQRILDLKPDDPTAHAMLATSLRAMGNCPDALRHYASSKALFPSRPDLLDGYAACLAETGDLKSALAEYQSLLAADPNDTFRYNVALLQWKTHNNDDALATLTPLLTGTHQVPALALASKIHEEQGDTPKSIALLREAILNAPDNPDNYLEFANLAFTYKSFQVGIDVLDAGLTRLPQAARLYLARGVLEVQISRNDAAVADFEQAHRLDPRLSFAVDAVGMMQSQQHQDAQSLALFQAQAKEHPEDPLLEYLLAEQLSQVADKGDNDKLREAILAAKRAADLDPTYQPAHDLLARLYVRSNQPKLAIEQAELALAHDPNDADALYQEIMVRRHEGDAIQLQALVARFNEAKKLTQQIEGKADRYRLQEPTSH